MSEECTSAIRDPRMKKLMNDLEDQYVAHKNKILAEKIDKPEELLETIQGILDTERRAMFSAIMEVICTINNDDLVLHIEEDGTMY